MRLASVMLIKRIAHPGSARCWSSSSKAVSTRKIAMLRCCLGASGLSLRPFAPLASRASFRWRSQRARSGPSRKNGAPSDKRITRKAVDRNLQPAVKKSKGKPARSIAVFTSVSRLHFNLFTLLHRRYTLQALVYQGCSTLYEHAAALLREPSQCGQANP